MFRLSKLVIILSAALAASSFELGDMDVVMHLFTRSNPTNSEPLLPVLQSILQSMSLDINRPSVITIHDYTESVAGNFNAFVVPAQLGANDVNLLAVDWSRGSSLYTQALGNAEQVGKVIATFVQLLIDNFGYQASQVTFVGHGFGAHIAAIAARNINGNIPHIVAIDPPLNGWYHNSNKLGPDAAELIEVLHVTIGSYGYDEPLGHLDFYPNGGSAQNGCGTDPSCSYQMGYIFYAESVQAEANEGTKFVGTKCEDWKQASAMACDGETGVYFGGSVPKTSDPGTYYFRTNPQPPHARG